MSESVSDINVIEIESANECEIELEEGSYTLDVIEEVEIEYEEVFPRKRNRKINVEPSKWKCNETLRNRELGLNYTGTKKIEKSEDGPCNQTWHYNIQKDVRVLKDRCNCDQKSKKRGCFNAQISDHDRAQLFSHFWDLSWEAKQVFICKIVERKETGRQRDRLNETKSRRNFSYTYTLQNVKVCKVMFLNTLCLGEKMVLKWKNNQGTAIAPPKTERERNKNASDRNKLRRDALKNFLQKLPRMPSHYCRSKTSKLYIEPMWSNTSELYRTYAHEVGSELILSKPIFDRVFDSMNLKLFRPRKDECETCVGHREGNISEDIYQEHRNRATSAQTEKANDKIGPFKVFAVDVQSVLLTPRNNTSTIYYKTRLIVHNYTVYNLKTNEAFCYVWDETNGNLNASNYASMLVSFIMENTDIGDTVIIYSDGCTSQNRNITISNALLNLCAENKLTIIQKILEKGHTQMEADSVHAAIEAQLRNKRINVPADLIQGMKDARKKKPYTVYHLSYQFFKDFTNVKLIRNNSIRPGFKSGDPVVTQIKALKYTPNLDVFYKLDSLSSDTPWLPLSDVQKKSTFSVSSPVPFSMLPPLYLERLKISLEKFNDLQELKVTIDADYHTFYDDLPHEISKKKVLSLNKTIESSTTRSTRSSLKETQSKTVRQPRKASTRKPLQSIVNVDEPVKRGRKRGKPQIKSDVDLADVKKKKSS